MIGAEPFVVASSMLHVVCVSPAGASVVPPVVTCVYQLELHATSRKMGTEAPTPEQSHAGCPHASSTLLHVATGMHGMQDAANPGTVSSRPTPYVWKDTGAPKTVRPLERPE